MMPVVTFDMRRALQLLRTGTQLPAAEFREGQQDAIDHLMDNRGRLLVVQKTGWGKSAVYFIATRLLRDSRNGPALLVSPLLALMRGQIAAAARMGVHAETINSDNADEWRIVEAKLKRDEVDILLISPERLANESFVKNVLSHVAARLSLFVIDEAHCISDWGHDFRPHYRLIQRLARNLPRNTRLLATTVTANNRVMDDLRAVLGPDLSVMRGDLNRPSLFLQTLRLPSPAARMAWICENLSRMPGSGIIYALTVRDSERLATWLKQEGWGVEAYSSQSADRERLEQSLLANRVKALVATTALGMGFDKPDLGFVVHYQAPASVIAYYQQVGRAGRALPSAYGVLLAGEEDTDISEYFIESAFPTRDEVRRILDVLKAHPRGLSIAEMMREVNVSYGRITKLTEVLSLESPSPLARDGSKWALTTTDLSEEFWDRADRLTKLRYEEQRQMQEYINLRNGHMEFLIRALDGNTAGIQRPMLQPLPGAPSSEILNRALGFLQRRDVKIQPRDRWPSGGMPKMNVKGKIPEDMQLREGRCLCFWGDPGWGEMVGKGKFQNGHFSDELVVALAELVKRWNPDPFPTWLSCVPSHRHPGLVTDMVQRFSQALNLPFFPAIRSVTQHGEQKLMQNSVMQAMNVDGVFAIDRNLVRSGPVFLLDDIVDSRWTMTVLGYLLREHGSGPVYPLALALASKS